METDKLFTTQESFSSFGAGVAIAGRDVMVADLLERGSRKLSGAVYIYR